MDRLDPDERQGGYLVIVSSGVLALPLNPFLQSCWLVFVAAEFWRLRR